MYNLGYIMLKCKNLKNLLNSKKLSKHSLAFCYEVRKVCDLGKHFQTIPLPFDRCSCKLEGKTVWFFVLFCYLIKITDLLSAYL